MLISHSLIVYILNLILEESKVKNQIHFNLKKCIQDV
jgi:hypothetical protein